MVLCFLAGVAYFAFGFCFGIFREWAFWVLIQTKEVRKTIPGKRILAAYLCFPETFGNVIFRDIEDDYKYCPICATDGGIAYWVGMGIFWPACLTLNLLSLSGISAPIGISWLGRICAEIQLQKRVQNWIRKIPE